MRHYLHLLVFALFLPLLAPAQGLPEPPKKYTDNQTVTYEEGIRYLRKLAAASPYLRLDSIGETDAGLPLHTAVFSATQTLDPERASTSNAAVWLLNNAIHPGEPDGVDASLRLLYELCQDKPLREEAENVVLVVIPFYNVGGALNRRHFTRVNQNGPYEMGFRGSARNYDLNRDFIKADTRNARTFFRIFHRWKPDFFVDTHVSNGADYQYTLTQLNTLPAKLSPPLDSYFGETFSPALVRTLEEKYDEPVTPYVNAWRNPPDSGFAQFLDLPRYSSGYAALFHTPAIVPELHMLKPYPRRVEATYHFLRACWTLLGREGNRLKELRREAQKKAQQAKTFRFGWQLDREQAKKITFRGYEAVYRQSPVTGQSQRYYDREKPYEKMIPFYDNYQTTRKAKIPKAFWVPQSAYQVLERLRMNDIRMEPLRQDTTLNLDAYYITEYQTRERPYEGHYQHFQTRVRSEKQQVHLRAGAVRIPTAQPGIRYLMETLWPEAEDSFFNWNFFDPILQQKEGISPYVFDGMAEKLLQQDPKLKEALEKKRASDPDFAANARAQLQFIYERSPYFEPEYLRYPIFGEP